MTSPFAPKNPGQILAVAGVEVNSIACKLKASGNTDLMLAILPEGTTAAGVFTQSLTSAAPVDYCKEILSQHDARALIVHAGNANAFTGRRGVALVQKTAAAVAAITGCHPRQVYIAGTGIIGELIPDERILDNIPRLHAGLRQDGLDLAARSIMTTDTFPKGSSRRANFGGKLVTISGIAKGAGMIAPDMATMLCFVFTDAKIEGDILQDILNRVNMKTFSNISIDGDTSTNDTLLLFATGVVVPERLIVSSTDPLLADFEEKLTEVLLDLALQVVRDGEGITKFITVTVKGARTDSDAHSIARSVAESPLVKTAIAGCNPNWGRIVMAVGKAGRPIKKERLKVWIGEHLLTVDGDSNDQLDLSIVEEYMQSAEISVDVDVGVGDKQATIWTCDLTSAYIEINSAYKT